MPTDHRSKLAKIKRFDQLIAYLRNEMDWPIKADDFDDLTFDYSAEELGIDPKNAAKIEEIKRMRPLSVRQPWGIFFVKFEPKRLPVVALRRILSQVVMKKRATARAAEQAAWAVDDLLFVSNYGEGDDRRICLAHFTEDREAGNLATLNVMGWDGQDTGLHLDAVAQELTEHLAWPKDDTDPEAWREQWRSAFTLRHREVITTASALAIRLAELARSIRVKVLAALAIETERGKLRRLMKAFQESLIHDLDENSFADMYAQTVAYGLLSARVSHHSGALVAEDAASIIVPVTSPFLRELMETFLNLGGRKRGTDGAALDFDELGINDVVDTLRKANMEAVLRDFGDKNPLEDPVIHFYEHFLAAYDKKMKVQRGVFYTPRPVVSFIVRSVDELLRTEFGLDDGLADTTSWAEMSRRHKGLRIPEGTPPEQAFVQILDPACGTGTFLVEVIDVVYRWMSEKWRAQGRGDDEIGSLWNEYVPMHLLPRLHGYELLMAPYAITHLKVGLSLFETGYRFQSNERARIYLTNSLEPAGHGQLRLDILPALAHEAQAVNEIKRQRRFTVVIGNPPYAGISSNMTPQIAELVRPYRSINGVSLGERKIWAQDDYKKFVRFAQVQISGSDAGVLGFITNHGFINEPTGRGMRHSLLQTFPRISLLDLHGSLRRREVSPDGRPDENIFDISIGTAISLMRRGGTAARITTHSDCWGSREEKYRFLAANTLGYTAQVTFSPAAEFFLFLPREDPLRSDSLSKVSLTEIFRVGSNGIQTSRDNVVYGFTLAECRQVIEEYRAPEDVISSRELRERYFPGKSVASYESGDTRGWSLPEARRKLRRDTKWESRFRRTLYRAFDYRVLFYADYMIDWPRSEVMSNMLIPNTSLCVGRAGRVAAQDWNVVLVANSLVDMNLFYGGNVNYPLHLVNEPSLVPSQEADWNFKPEFLGELTKALGVAESADPDLPHEISRDDIFRYIYAVLHSPSYRERYSELLSVDYPQVPLTRDRALFLDASRLGGELVALHLMESPKLAHFITTFKGPKNPEVVRVGWSEDTVWLDAAATKKGQLATPGTIGFRGVPEVVWNFHIGGYRVCEKWLKDRKGRTLSKDDIIHYQKIVVALNETIRLMMEIDEVIEAHGGWPDAFEVGEKAEAASQGKIVAFPVPGRAWQAEAKPLRKAAEKKGKYKAGPRRRKAGGS